MRIILMCGKGGVGKSALSAALGVRAAEGGQRTLVYSVDPAHSLAWTFNTEVGPLPTAIAANLWAAEIEPMAVLEDQWADMRAYVESIMRGQGLEQGIGREVGSLPGVHEMAALTKLKQYADSGQFDVIVVDHAPTAFALRLLSLPETLGWYARHGKRIWERYSAQAMMAIPMFAGNFPLPTGNLISRTLEQLEQLRGLPALLADPAKTSARLVLTPDALALNEARELYTHLSLYGLTTDQAIVNRALPLAVTDLFFDSERAREAQIRAEVEADFGAIDRHWVESLEHPPQGIAALTELARRAFPATDPVARQTQDLALRITQEDGRVQVDIKLPFVAAKDVDLAKFESELYITIGRHRRILLLPPEASEMQPVKAKFSDGRLLVTLATTT